MRKIIFYSLLVMLPFNSILGQNLEKHILYSPESSYFTALLLINSEFKVLTNMRDFILLGEGNIINDTLSANEYIGGKDQVFSILVIDSLNFNIICDKSSHVLSIKNNSIEVIKSVNYKDKRNYGKFAHIYLTKDREIAVEHVYKKNENILIYKIYDVHQNLVSNTEIKYSGIFNNFTSVAYTFPEDHYLYKNKLVFPNSFNNKLYFIDLESQNLRKIDLLEFDLNQGSQHIMFDRQKQAFFMLRDTGKVDSTGHNYELFQLDIYKNEYYKLKEFSFQPSSFRGGLFNGKFLMTGFFNGHSTWFSVPISSIDLYNERLNFDLNE